jgi:hypothetical protein
LRAASGRAFCSRIYAWGRERVLKLFHARVAPRHVEREFLATRAVHEVDLPAPVAFEVIEVEGRRGIVFERVERVSLLGYAQSRPWAVFHVKAWEAPLAVAARFWRAPTRPGE